ncbi:adenylate kinase [Aerococcaceae bacterium NML191292]|nr:adenylate kinase [Aerococcaceae bacterium NML210727]MCW6654769.1 adenylate kinase [Aerococcaceae bacterium NML201296]MCW6659017.1 adenylate kinase [Aerococcaceae bacterium NML191292]
MKKIMVIGCPGSGKSTFSKVLHDMTGIPLYHLDMLNWNADRTTVDKAVFLKRLLNTINKSEWIIDGNYGSTIELRLKACDTVVFMDYPLDICLTGIKERKGKPRTDLPWVEIDEDDTEFIEFVKNYNSQSRPKILELLAEYRNKEVHIFKNRRDADEYLKSLQRQISVCRKNTMKRT